MHNHTPPEWHQQCDLLRGLVFDAEKRTDLATGSGFFLRTDAAQLEDFAMQLQAQVATRRDRGAASLVAIYRRSLQGIPPSEQGRLFGDYCRSTGYRSFGALVDRATQISQEEAFYRFLCEREIGDPEVRHAEFIEAMIRALAVQPRPAFLIPREIQGASFGYYALALLAGRHYLFALADQRVIRGPIAATSAWVLRSRGHRPAESIVGEAEWAQRVAELARLGLVFL